ncbi:von Willebrand factor [Rubripirellula amarantea]|uniref:von Willebrand factor n=1 Tax=Rubripirellula amarantea TaxID=2527999 RepID=A0A5C5WHY2_9BACT|nr:von Willebrand factor type A domain-containing protein [Rubripirellula amarantea]TWT49412.1 von Willebrand factor [Rubripirellula amarantea]
MSDIQVNESYWDDPRITAYVLGELDGSERDEFEQAMRESESLAQAVEEAREVTGQLAGLFESQSQRTLDPARRAAIMNEPVTLRESDAGISRRAIWGLLAIAAALLLVLGVGPMLSSSTLMQVSQVESKALVTAESNESSLARSELSLAPESGRSVAPELDASVAADEMADEMEDRASDSGLVSAAGSSPYGARGIDEMSSQRSMNGNEIAAQVELAPASVATPEVEYRDSGVVESTTKLQSKSSPSSPMGMESDGARGFGGAGYGVQLDAQNTKVQEELDASGIGGGGMGGYGLPSDTTALDFAEEQAGDSLDLFAEVSPAAKPSRRSRQPRGERRDGDDMDMMMMMGGGMMGEGMSGAGSNDTSDLGAMDTEMQLGMGGAYFGVDALGSRGLSREIGSGKNAGDRFGDIVENPFKRVADEPLSTFSVDVDTASYSKIRDYVLRTNRLPSPDAVRIEEMINYFDYSDAPPADDAEHPFAARVNVTSCPWNEDHRLARLAIKGKTMQPKERPASNLVFLIDTSGSMQEPNKLPLVIDGLKMLTKQLSERDRVAIVVYASSTGLVLDSTLASDKKKIRKALKQLTAGGSTNGGAGILLAYQTARDHFIDDGVNRVILCTDGDFNVGTTSTDELVKMVEAEAKGDVFLTVLGYGMGNHNDAMLEQISGKGNGNYAFIDSQREARKVLVRQMAGTLVTIAKDVKLQVEFNPGKVAAYRLIGYENRMLAKEDFNDDKKDAGEIGAGHSVTALYELVPAGVKSDVVAPAVDELKYQKSAVVKQTEQVVSDDTMTLKLRYKQPNGDNSVKVEFPVLDDGAAFTDASIDHQFTAAVAGLGMLLRGSPNVGAWKLNDVLQVAKLSKGDDVDGLRAEFIQIVRKVSQLTHSRQ